jgi:hypothetical protein
VIRILMMFVYFDFEVTVCSILQMLCRHWHASISRQVRLMSKLALATSTQLSTMYVSQQVS